jgi:bifunctional non-homologous end joining protein LigD
VAFGTLTLLAQVEMRPAAGIRCGRLHAALQRRPRHWIAAARLLRRDGDLIYAGRAGTGFTRKTHELLRDRLDALRQAKPAFHDVPAEAKKDAIWVKPSTVIEARFAAWTSDNLVRQAAFLGLREDKDPKEVIRETAGPVPKSSGKRQHEEKFSPKSAKPPAKTAQHPAPAATAAKIETPAPSKSRSDRAQVAGVSISHPDKILDEESRLTKLQLAEYYDAVADHLLPHIADRPLSIVRCPEGSGKPCFFQKQIGKGMPVDASTACRFW